MKLSANTGPLGLLEATAIDRPPTASLTTLIHGTSLSGRRLAELSVDILFMQFVRLSQARHRTVQRLEW
jgi:hypothetical protein